MSSVNKVILVGYCGKDPEIRYMTSGDAVTVLSLATTDKYKDKQSKEQKESTEWHSVVFFGKLAEIAGQYLKKGSQCYIEGRLRTRKFTDANGIEKYSTQIVAESMKMLGGKPSDSSTDGQPQNQKAGSSTLDAMDDDIPF